MAKEPGADTQKRSLLAFAGGYLKVPEPGGHVLARKPRPMGRPSPIGVGRLFTKRYCSFVGNEVNSGHE